MIHSHVWPGSVVRAHHCCLQKVRKLSSNESLFLISLANDKDVSNISLGRFLLSQLMQEPEDASVAHAILTGVSLRAFSEFLEHAAGFKSFF